jgi:FixJ family two-component response regulator
MRCPRADRSVQPMTEAWKSLSAMKRILVVDDDASMARAVERLLKARGFAVETFLTVDGFMERANLRDAACLVLDIDVNGASGIALKRRLTEAGFSLPVIFITASVAEATRRAALSAGCVAYLSKPFSSKELVAAVETAQGNA